MENRNSPAVQKANKARGIPRNGNDGYKLIKRQIKDMNVKVGQHNQYLRNAYIADYEIPYQKGSYMKPFRDEIWEHLQEKALKGYFEGKPPKLYKLDFYTTHHGNYMIVSAIFNLEWVEA